MHACSIHVSVMCYLCSAEVRREEGSIIMLCACKLNRCNASCISKKRAYKIRTSSNNFDMKICYKNVGAEFWSHSQSVSCQPGKTREHQLKS